MSGICSGPEVHLWKITVDLAISYRYVPVCGTAEKRPKTSESVEKLDAEQILFAVTIPCRAIGTAGRNTDDDGTAEPD